jgi:acyl carrier protein
MNMTSPETVREGLAAILNEIAGTDPATVVDAAAFKDDLEVDSLTMVEVVVAAEERFGIRIPDTDIEGLVTVGDAVSYIAKVGISA